MISQEGLFPTAETVVRLERPARALIGWMDQDEALLTLSGRRQDVTPTREHVHLLERARVVVAARPEGVDQEGIEQPAPASLAPHIAQLQNTPSAAPYFQGGNRVAMIDLTRVVAAQPIVHTDHAEERASEVDADDVVSVASVSLPVAVPPQLPAQYDPNQRAWVFSSANPNLRIVGYGAAPANGSVVFGFMVGLLPSFVRVAHYQGRYLLVDGYHRSYGFLRRGITHVPAFVADVMSFKGLGLPENGMLPQEAFLGDRPPVMLDYLDSELSVVITVPATQRTVVIPGLEVNATG